VAVPWLRKTVKRLVDRGHELTVIAPSYSGLRSHEIDGIKVHRFRYAPRRWEKLTHEEGAPNRIRNKANQLLGLPYVISGSISTALLAKRGKFHIINVHWPFPHGMMAWLGKRFCNATVVSTCHGAELAMAKQTKWVSQILRLLLLDADALTCNSTHTAREIIKLCGRKANIIPYGTTVEVRDSQNNPNNPPVILFTGRLIERKGVDYLIKAMPLLLKKTKAKLLITGEGDCREKWEKMTMLMGLQDCVEFLGFVSNDKLSELYRTCDVYVLPAIHDVRGDTEGLGVVLIEALMHRRPVVASSVGGIVDVIKHEETGLLVPEKDEKALAAAILRLLNDSELKRRLGVAGLEFAKWHFDWDRIINDLEKVFFNAIEEHQAKNLIL
jgi:glycosyltransferase involved in cell wall biosynthesis